MPPYAFSTPSSETVLLALSSERQRVVRQSVAETVRERERLLDRLSALACVVKCWPSDGNFLLVRFQSLTAVTEALLRRSILIRSFDDCELLRDCARITVGDRFENDLLLDTLAELPGNRE